MAWSLLFQKTLKPKDKSTLKLKSRNSNFTDFYNSIPSPAIKNALWTTQRFADPVPVETKNGTALAAVETHDVVARIEPPVAPYGCSFWIYWSDVLRRVDFKADRDIMVYYDWDGERLRLKMEQPETPYKVDLDQEPREWRLLGQKKMLRCDVGLGRLLIPQSDIREFVESSPTAELRRMVVENKNMDVEIYTAGGIAQGQLHTVASLMRDMRSTAIVVKWGQAAKLMKARRLGDGTILKVWFRWAFGQLELAITTFGQALPAE